MNRPSFQFYPADWRNNAKLRRCSFAARGAWIEILGVLHDSDEYGVCRWPLTDLACSAGVPIKLARELVEKSVLKGGDQDVHAFTHTTRHAGQDGDTHILIEPSTGPCWYSSRLVWDEWKRKRSGGETRFKSPSQPPIRRHGDDLGGGASSSSSSSSSSKLTTKGATKPLKALHWEVAKRLEAILAEQWVNDAGKWVNRLKSEHSKAVRVVAEVESAVKEDRIKTSPAQYAEQIWKEFK